MSRAKRVAWGTLGILAGIATGTVLSVTFLDGPGALVDAVTRELDPHATDSISIGICRTALLWSSLIGAIAVPLWMGLGLLRRSGRIDALWLGAVLGAPFALLFEGSDRLAFAPRLAAVGAAAGIVTWLVSHRTPGRRPPQVTP
jgi:hypothetical protein